MEVGFHLACFRVCCVIEARRKHILDGSLCALACAREDGVPQMYVRVISSQVELRPEGEKWGRQHHAKLLENRKDRLTERKEEER